MMSNKHLFVVALLAGLLVTIATVLYTGSELKISRPTLTTTTSLPQDTACLQVLGSRGSGGMPFVFVESQKINSCQTKTNIYPVSFVLNWALFTTVIYVIARLFKYFSKK